MYVTSKCGFRTRDTSQYLAHREGLANSPVVGESDVFGSGYMYPNSGHLRAGTTRSFCLRYRHLTQIEPNILSIGHF
jgi:hypothetical protein